MHAVGVTHGRFQVLHHYHLKYLLAGKARCRQLVVGVTNPAFCYPGSRSQQTEESAQSFSLPKSQDLLQGANILVVDDEPTMTSRLSDLLALHGAQVSPFNDPHEALASFRFNPQAVDLVITDETMPGLTGMHMAEQMLHIRPTLPIILCTGFSERANA